MSDVDCMKDDSSVICDRERMKDHYRNLLSRRYTWIYGGFDAKSEESAALFSALGVTKSDGVAAIDLGAGSGFQSVPLARLGYAVTAVDLSRDLLDEIPSHSGGLHVNTVESDLADFLRATDVRAGIIVCMGDTLTHLESMSRVRELIALSAAHLRPGGKLILTFRDYERPLEGASRFIPVRSDENAVFTCFTEYFPGYLDVYDILHERNGSSWTQHVSSYRKLRLPRIDVESWMRSAGLTVSGGIERGMITLCGVK